MASQIKPLGNRVLVRRSKARASKGGILLPDAAQEKPREGVIEGVGTGWYNEETGKQESLSLKHGDKVLFSSYAGTEVQSLSNEHAEYLILLVDDILALLS